MYLWIDSRCALEKGGGGISSMLNLVIGLLSGTRAITGFCDLELRPYPEQVTHAENLLLQFKIQRFKVASN
jgi:hypothetical protein